MQFLDFFSGIGGFRLGMEMAGHECVGHCEIDKYADKSYRAMHQVKETEFYATDITNVEPRDLPTADIFCGGFPCQSFSIAGKRGGFNDTRGTLFFEIMRLAVIRKPTYLFLENVKGLLSHDNGSTFATILESLWECGYSAEWQVLNSKDYGVPQNRERVFIVGHLGGKSKPKVFPIRESNSRIDKGNGEGTQANISPTIDTRVGALTHRSPYVLEPSNDEATRQTLCKLYKQDPGQPFRKISDASICDIGTELASTVMARYHKGIAGHKDNMVLVERGIHQDRDAKIAIPVLTPERPEKRQNGRRFKEDGEDMFTLTAQDKHGVLVEQPKWDKELEIFDDFKSHNLYGTNLAIRKLTPLECFRLQGFPDEYFRRAEAVNSDSQLYKQAGNSVTVNVIHEIAKRL